MLSDTGEALTLFEATCLEGQIRSLQSYLYDPDEKLLISGTGPGAWSYPQPGSFLEAALQRLCRARARGVSPRPDGVAGVTGARYDVRRAGLPHVDGGSPMLWLTSVLTESSPSPPHPGQASNVHQVTWETTTGWQDR
jgi:hypothetical protein